MSGPGNENIGLENLGEMLDESGVHLNGEQLGLLWNYHQALREQDRTLNLTRIHNFRAMVRKHYVDSLIVLQVLEQEGLSLPSRLLDLGSGAGLPGIPLAIARPDCGIVLAEGRAVRVRFLEETIASLGLQNVTVFGRKIRPGLPLPPVDGVISRAVERMEITIERLAPSLKPGARFYFMKGPNCDDELETVTRENSEICTLVTDAHYTLPGSRDHRRLVVWELTERQIRSQTKTAPGPAIDPERDERILLFESADNPRIKMLRTLQISRSIKKHGVALICGRKLVFEFLGREATKREFLPPEDNQALIYPRSDDFFHTIGGELRLRATARTAIGGESPQTIPIWALAEKVYREIDFLNTGPPLLLRKIPEMPAWNGELSGPGCTLFLPLGDPENLGAALRSAAAFGVQNVVLLREAAHPFHPRSIRAAAGQAFRLGLWNGPSLAELSEQVDFPLFALAGDGIDLKNFKPPTAYGLVVGEEGKGLPREFRARRLAIPIAPAVDSLNAAVALGIVLYELQAGY